MNGLWAVVYLLIGVLLTSFYYQQETTQLRLANESLTLSLQMVRDRDHTHVRYCWKQGNYWDCSDTEKPWDENKSE